MERTAYEPGTPCWVDLAEPDVDATAHFAVLADPQGATFSVIEVAAERSERP